jgi:hypothetical protein
MEIGGERYHLQFSDQDATAIEQQFKPIPMLFQPALFGFDVARIFLWKGLKTEQPDGSLIYACTQDTAGFEDALQKVKRFTGSFPGPVLGLSLIFGSVNKALVVSGWYQDPKAPKEEPKEGEVAQKVDPTKNSVRPTKRPTKRSRTGSVN